MIKIETHPTESPLTGQSKWWGEPDMPEEFDWPEVTVTDEAGETEWHRDWYLTYRCLKAEGRRMGLRLLLRIHRPNQTCELTLEKRRVGSH